MVAKWGAQIRIFICVGYINCKLSFPRVTPVDSLQRGVSSTMKFLGIVRNYLQKPYQTLP